MHLQMWKIRLDESRRNANSSELIMVIAFCDTEGQEDAYLFKWNDYAILSTKPT